MIGYERRLLAGLLFLVLASLPTLVFASYSLSAVSTSQDRLNRDFTGKLLLIQNLRMQKAQQGALMPIFVISGLGLVGLGLAEDGEQAAAL
ncbi:MAG: hypothetical protein ACRYG8_15010 [Janthinobacterium lividum]